MGDDPLLVTFSVWVIVGASTASIALGLLAWDWPDRAPRRAIGVGLLVLGTCVSVVAGIFALLPIGIGVAILRSGSHRPK